MTVQIKSNPEKIFSRPCNFKDCDGIMEVYPCECWECKKCKRTDGTDCTYE